MKKVTVRVPLRADLAGGTLDLWPLYLFHGNPRTVNVAIGLHAECDVVRLNEQVIEVALGDTGYHRRYANGAELAQDPKVALIAKAVEHFGANGIRIVTRTEAPRGSGLGGSSALAIALVRALSEIVEKPVEGDELIELVRDLETRLLKIPAGVQDYYPPVYGGLAALHLNPGKILRRPISYPVHELAQHLIVHYSDVAHFSGTNNWEIYKRHIDGDEEIHAGLNRIAEISIEMERALEARNIEAAASALDQEWQARKALIRGISTPEIEKAIEVAKRAGAWSAKVCGAGGGGSIVILAPAEKREKVVAALSRAPGRTLQIAPVMQGLVMEGAEDQQGAFSFGRRSRTAGTGEPIEQLYLRSGDEGSYRPYALAEGSVTFDEPRIGVHHNIVRAFVAPIDTEAHEVNWNSAIPIDAEHINLSAVPESGKPAPSARNTDWMELIASEGEDHFRGHLRTNQRLMIFHNSELGLHSEVNEEREAFLQRCSEVAHRLVDDTSQKLEATFRRRIDQMRERSERDQREAADSDEPELEQPQDVAISWGQTLHNITSGRPAMTSEPQSVAEADYRDKIAQLQRQWERELQIVREEQERKARNIEEVILTPALKNVEVVKFVILWATSIKPLVVPE